MTDENRRANILAEVERAALLLARGVEPRSYKGALHLFNREFVRPNIMPSRHNRLLAGLQRSRELADYDSAVQFSSDDALAEIAAAEEFRDQVMGWLRTQGWIDRDPA
jgi:uncharacterized protein (UPF0332 family)